MNALIEAGRTDHRFKPPHSSLHVGKFEGGIAFNVIAKQATIDWDVRTIPQDDAYEIRAAFDNYCRERESILRKYTPILK